MMCSEKESKQRCRDCSARFNSCTIASDARNGDDCIHSFLQHVACHHPALLHTVYTCLTSGTNVLTSTDLIFTPIQNIHTLDQQQISQSSHS